MEDKVKSLDEIISADCGGDLKKARDLFKSVVQDILSSSEFRIENTVRNIGIKKPITKGKFNQIKPMLAENINNVNIVKSLKDNPLLVSQAKQQGLDMLLQKFNKSDNESDDEYKNFIAQLVSLENYFDENQDEGKQIKKVYDKIESSLQTPDGDNDMGFDLSELQNFQNLVLFDKLSAEDNKQVADRILQEKCSQYIKSKMYKHKNDLFSILDAIAAVDLELCMKELDELIKSEEKTENAKEDEKNDNENKIIINKEPNPTKEKEEKVKNIKEQLKHRARLLGFNSSNAFCDVIDKISTEPIDQFKNFVKNCQDKFDKYQKDYGFIPMVPSLTKNEEEKKLLIEVIRKAQKFKLNIVKYFYDEAKKRAKEILKQKEEDEKNKNNPKILAVEFVLDLMDNMDNKNLNTEISQRLQFLANGIKQLDKDSDFGFDNLSSIVKSMESKKDLLDQNSAKKFYNLLEKINSDYCKIILEAINNLRGSQSVNNFLKDILNQQDKTLVSDFFAFAFDGQQSVDQQLQYTKKFLLVMVDQLFVNLEEKIKDYKFLSCVFKPYFDEKISGANTTKGLKPIIESVSSMICNARLSADPKTSLDLLINNVDKIKDKNDLKVFFDSYSWSFDDIKNDDAKQYENRKLLVDLKDIFLDDVMHQFNNSAAITHIGSVAKWLTKLDNKMDSKKYESKDFLGLGEVLYDYEQKSIKNKIKNDFPLLEATLAFQAHYGFAKLNINAKRKLFKRLVNIKDNGLQDQDKKDLKDYFWSHATEIFKQKEEFTQAETKEFYGFIQGEKEGDNQYFKLLNSAITDLELNSEKCLADMLKQDDNFNNIIALKNGEEGGKKKAYKSILKSLVKQRLNQKGGFVSGTYLKHYENQIDNNKITDKSQSQIVSGVQNVLGENFRPDSNILIESIEDLDNNNLFGFWLYCQKAKKNPAEENKNEEKIIITINNQPIDDKARENNNIDDKDKILSELSDIFLDLLDNDNKKAKNKNEINTSNDNPTNVNKKDNSNLVDVTKKFVAELYQQNKEKEKEDNSIINTNENKKNNQVKKDDTGITKVLQEYYNKHRLYKEWLLGRCGNGILEEQIANFHSLDGASKIKLLRCMKNVKNNTVTNDDLVYINLYRYRTKYAWVSMESPFSDLQLTTDQQNNEVGSSNQVLHKFFNNGGWCYEQRKIDGNFQSCYMNSENVEAVIKNIGKQKIIDPKDRRDFANAVKFVLEIQINNLNYNYKHNIYETIDTVENYRQEWTQLMNALKDKGLVSEQQQAEFNAQMNIAYNVSNIIAVGEWILVFLGSIATIGILPAVSEGIRRTFHSPIKSRKTRYLIKSIESKDNDGRNNGIFSVLYEITDQPIPKQENSMENTDLNNPNK